MPRIIGYLKTYLQAPVLQPVAAWLAQYARRRWSLSMIKNAMILAAGKGTRMQAQAGPAQAADRNWRSKPAHAYGDAA